MKLKLLAFQDQKQNGECLLRYLIADNLTELILPSSSTISGDFSRYHDGSEIISSDHVKLSDSGESYKLELKDAQLSDAGTYKCKISNRLGEKTHEAKLSLICEFNKYNVILRQLMVIELTKEGSCSLSVQPSLYLHYIC
jgi:hypothetical protein